MYLQNLIRTKDQVISKGKFSVFNSSKKRTKKINFCPSLSTTAELLRSFFGRIEDTTISF